MRIFSEVFTERRRGSSGWVVAIPKHRTSLDSQINLWASEHDVRLMDVKLNSESTDSKLVKEGNADVWERVTSCQCIILYEPLNPEVFDYEHQANEEEKIPPMPVKVGATAPTVEVSVTEKGVVRTAYAMAGVFGVPEGLKLGMEDDGPAPVPLLSPDMDWKPYARLFGNVEKVNEPAAAGS